MFVQNIGRDDFKPERNICLNIHNHNQPQLNSGPVSTMSAQCIERIIPGLSGERSGIHVAASAKIRIGLPHFGNQRFEEALLVFVVGQFPIIGGIAVKKTVADICKNI